MGHPGEKSATPERQECPSQAHQRERPRFRHGAHRPGGGNARVGEGHAASGIAEIGAAGGAIGPAPLGVELVQLDGGQFRTDIGGKAARGEIKVQTPGAAAATKAKA